LFFKIQQDPQAFMTDWVRREIPASWHGGMRETQNLRNYFRAMLKRLTSGNMPFQVDTLRRINGPGRQSNKLSTAPDPYG
jgi:hypothetical protein